MDHFIFACKELAVYLSFLFSALLVHGHVPSDTLVSRLIPIPKGKNTNITNSANYRAIALSSVFVKVFDVIFMVALWNRADHYIFALWLLLSSFFVSSPNLSRRRLDVCHTSTQS